MVVNTNNTECTTKPFNCADGIIKDLMMCVGALVGEGRDSCSGDGCGPLIVQGNQRNKSFACWNYFYGRRMCTTTARVSYIIDW